MDRVKRKEILHQLAIKDLAEFRKNLPVDENVFPKLFDFIDEKLSEQDCQNDFTIASKFCDKLHIDKQVLFSCFLHRTHLKTKREGVLKF